MSCLQKCCVTLPNLRIEQLTGKINFKKIKRLRVRVFRVFQSSSEFVVANDHHHEAGLRINELLINTASLRTTNEVYDMKLNETHVFCQLNKVAVCRRVIAAR